MKRAEAEVAGTSLFQLYEFSYHINNVDAAKYLLYGILTYQFVYLFRTISKATKIIKREKPQGLFGNNIGHFDETLIPINL